MDSETPADTYWRKLWKFHLECEDAAKELSDDREPLRGTELEPEQAELLEKRAKLRRLNAEQRKAIGQ